MMGGKKRKTKTQKKRTYIKLNSYGESGEEITRLKALSLVRDTDTSDRRVPIDEEESNVIDLDGPYEWTEHESRDKFDTYTRSLIELTSAEVSETSSSFTFKFIQESYKVDIKNGFMAANSFTKSKSFVAERNGKINSLVAAKIKQSDYAKVRFKVEPEGIYMEREMSLMQLRHKNLITLLGCDDFKGQYMYMYPYYEYTLQMIRNKLPNNTIHIYDANVPRKISLEILSALEYLHKEKFSHRGIKDSNVYIQRESKNAEWLQNGEFVSILGENSVLKCEKTVWQITHCEPDSGIITPESSESDAIFGNDRVYIEAKNLLKKNESSFKEFDHWLKFDLLKAIELIVELYGHCGFSNKYRGGIIEDFESMTFMQEFGFEDLKSHPIFMTRKESFIMLQTVAQEIGENYKVFRSKIDKQNLEKIIVIGKVLLGPNHNWLEFIIKDKQIFENNLMYSGRLLIGKYFNKFLNFVHILLKHVPEMNLSLLGIKDKWDFMDYITQNMPNADLPYTKDIKAVWCD